MKRFSFLLMGAFLFGAMAFVLADEATNTGNVADTESGAVVEVTTGDTVEATTGDTVEATTGTTAEATTGTTAEATTGDTAEVTTGDTVEATTGDTVEATTGTIAEATETEDVTTPTISDSAKEKYNEEQITAYEWAFEKGITTMNDIDKARLSDGLTRAELAKMMSQYMTKVLGKTPVDVEKANYSDVDESLGDLADFIQTAYAYKIMGINADGTPLKEFNPNGLVTRAEYATVFSRVLFGDKYNKAEGNYYEDHLNALKEAGILTNTTPDIQEVRGWVMLMMYRSNNVDVESSVEDTSGSVIGMANPASVYCEEQGGTVNIVKDEEGNESGMCKLADGTEVDEWEYYRANNPETDTAEATTGDTAEVATGDAAKSTETN